jgi:7-cyano-7-deazaguanine synthase in queuosine biosynthesis
MSVIAPSTKPIMYCFDFSDLRTVRGGPFPQNQENVPPIVNEYFVNDRTISSSFGQRLDPLLADWIDVALATYISDRLSSRRARGTRNTLSWSRTFRLTIPVRELKVWQRESVQTALQSVLRFLTDDVWHIEFVPKNGPARRSETDEYLLPIPVRHPVHVALFSGGLDSFAGAVNQIDALPDHSFVFVSGATNSRHKYAQREQIRVLSRRARQEVCHVVVPFGFNWHGRIRETIQESTQRTRGFVFLTLGAVTAIAAKSSQLHVYENGIGAINLPYDATQLGTANSRGVNPLTLLFMANFTEQLTGQGFRFENPYLFATKTEMCRNELVQLLAPSINLTFSCDGFPVRAHNKPQCGSCTSCLLRRLSLECSGLSGHDLGSKYIVDLSNSRAMPSTRQLEHLRAMEWQFHKFNLVLRHEDPWRALTMEFPELQTLSCEISSRNTLDAKTFEESIIRLYSRYVSEWQTFSARSALQRRALAA